MLDIFLLSPHSSSHHLYNVYTCRTSSRMAYWAALPIQYISITYLQYVRFQHLIYRLHSTAIWPQMCYPHAPNSGRQQKCKPSGVVPQSSREYFFAFPTKLAPSQQSYEGQASPCMPAPRMSEGEYLWDITDESFRLPPSYRFLPEPNTADDMSSAMSLESNIHAHTKGAKRHSIARIT